MLLEMIAGCVEVTLKDHWCDYFGRDYSNTTYHDFVNRAQELSKDKHPHFVVMTNGQMWMQASDAYANREDCVSVPIDPKWIEDMNCKAFGVAIAKAIIEKHRELGIEFVSDEEIAKFIGTN